MSDETENRDTTREDNYLEAKTAAVRIWTIIGCIVLLIAVVRGLALVSTAFQLLLMGIIFGFICSSMTNYLEDRGVSRQIAALISVFVLIAVIATFLGLLLPAFFDQVVALLQRVPDYVVQVRASIDELWVFLGDFADESIQANVSNLLAEISNMLTSFSRDIITQLTTGLIPNIIGTFSNVAMFFLSLILAYWLALDYPRIVHELTIIAGPEHRDETTLLLAIISRSMGGYMQGTLITSGFLGLFTALGLLIVGHPYAVLMGITAGILHIIPVIGPWIATALAVMLALISGPLVALWSLIITVVAANIAGNVVSPFVMQTAVSVHPALSLVAIFVGAALGGITGMILAIPLSAAIKGGFVYYFETRTGRQLVSYDGALFRGTPFHDEEGNIMPTYDALDDDKFFESTRLVSSDEEAPFARPDERPVDMPTTVGEVLQQRVAELRGVSEGDSRSTRLARAHRARHSRKGSPREDSHAEPGPDDSVPSDSDRTGRLFRS